MKISGKKAENITISRVWEKTPDGSIIYGDTQITLKHSVG